MILIINENDTNHVTLFIHMPKSGGNTFQSIISKQKQYNSDTCIWRYCEAHNLTTEEQKRIELVCCGHIPFGYHNNLPQTNFNYIAFLRHPVERLISFFYYLRSENNGGIEVRDMFSKMTLFDYVSNEKFNRSEDIFPGSWVCATVNSQTRMLAGTMEDDFETAKNNLEKYFSIVGITERFDETLRVVEKKLGWEINGYEKINVTPNKPVLEEIPNEIIEIIKSKNEKDIALYEYANHLLDEQLKSIKA